MSSLSDLLDGKADKLVLKGTPPSSVVASFRVLSELGILTPAMVWSMLSTVAVDPFHLIRMIRANKTRLGFHQEEHVVGEDIAFLLGDKNSLGYRVTYHVNVFSDDVTVLVRRGEEYAYHSGMSPLDLLHQIETEKEPDKRLELILKIIESQLQAALLSK